MQNDVNFLSKFGIREKFFQKVYESYSWDHSIVFTSYVLGLSQF